MKVPFLDLKAQYATIKDEITTAIQGVFDSCAFAGGPFVEKFEREWAAYCGTKHAIGVGNGTDALWLALLALGIRPGDEVVTVASTFMATAEAISLTGAVPVFVDIDSASYTMDPSHLEAAITKRTRAVIPVHLFGQPADMDPVTRIARKHGIAVIEDACQAHGAEYQGRRAGALADAAAFSFYPGKNLGAYGEAGAVTTDRDDVAEIIRMLRDHGQARKYHHDHIGWNARMDGIQGAVLSVKLRHLDAWNEKRRAHAEAYQRRLDTIPGIELPRTRGDIRHVYHVYAVRVQQRDSLLGALQDEGVSCGVHYPVAVHQQKAYSGLSGAALPVTERCAREFLSLPMFAELDESQILHVGDALEKAAAGARG